MKRLLVALIATVMGLTLMITPASAYSVHAYRMTEAAISNGVAVCYGDAIVGSALWDNRHAVMDTIEVWEEYTTINFFNDAEPCTSSDNENMIVKLKDLGDNCAGTSVTLATTVTPSSGWWNVATTYLNADCWDDGLYFWGSGTVPSNKVDGASILAHETGHVMGLCHTNDNNSNSNSCIQYTPNPSGPDLMDVLGPAGADCTEVAGIPFVGRRIIHASHDDRDGFNIWYKAQAQNGGSPVIADCVS